MSVFDENIIKKDLSVETILQQNVSDVVNTAYHDIQYRINYGQTLFKLHSNKPGYFDVGATGDFIIAFKDAISRGLDGLKERLGIRPINWNDAKLNINNIDVSILPSNEKINVGILIDYKIFKSKRFIGEPSIFILDMGSVSYMYILEEFEIPLDRPSIRLFI